MQAAAEGRGVYLAHYTIEGFPVLYAMKRNGDRLPRVVVLRPMVDRAAATAWLRAQLDQHDPGPRLVVEKPAVPPPPESSTAYAMRIARKVQIAGTVRRIR